jgi:hypothetical protein
MSEESSCLIGAAGVSTTPSFFTRTEQVPLQRIVFDTEFWEGEVLEAVHNH